MTPDSAQAFGVALMAMWVAAGAVALGRSVAKSPAARELAAAVRRMNLAAKGALVAGLVGAVAIGGTKPGGNDPQRQAAHPVSAMRTVAGTNAPPGFPSTGSSKPISFSLSSILPIFLLPPPVRRIAHCKSPDYDSHNARLPKPATATAQVYHVPLFRGVCTPRPLRATLCSWKPSMSSIK